MTSTLTPKTKVIVQDDKNDQVKRIGLSIDKERSIRTVLNRRSPTAYKIVTSLANAKMRTPKITAPDTNSQDKTKVKTATIIFFSHSSYMHSATPSSVTDQPLI